MQYDLAHSKGGIQDEDEVLETKKAEEKKKKELKRQKEKAKRKKNKAISNAADAMTKAAVAMKDIVKGDSKAETKTDGKTVEEKKEASSGEAKNETNEETKVTGMVDTKATEKQTVEAQRFGTDSKPDNSLNTPTKPPGEPTKTYPTASVTGVAKDAPAPIPEKEEPQETKPVEEVLQDEEPEEEDDDSESEEEQDDEEGDVQTWNAVCVLGLRVYSRDPEIAIELVKTEDAEEATTLTVEGKPAGATM